MTEAIIPLVSLIALEVILGIDNIIFISILADRLPRQQQKKLRLWGLTLAMLMRLLLLGFLSWILKLDQTLFTIYTTPFTGKALILIAGGLFLLYKSTREIYHKTEVASEATVHSTYATNFSQLLGEVILLDLVFSIDSIITAVGMVQELWVMYAAVVITVGIMMLASGPISSFIHRHPSFKILALCFLLMIGLALFADGLGFHIPKGYIYFSMAFAFLVDIIQMNTVGRKKE